MAHFDANFINSIHAIDSQTWNSLCCTDYPFLRHEFFAALEASGSTTIATGWKPHHLLLRGKDSVLAIIPLFLKYHSYGEYVFDWGWAEAWIRHGFEYYPKLLNAIPFTPCAGPRWGINPALDSTVQSEVLQACFEAISLEVERKQLSSFHSLFHQNEANQTFKENGYLNRLGCQYHWLNQGYQSFDDFLSTMTARKRKSLKRERRLIAEQGLTLTQKEGEDISDKDWHLFYQFYHLTYLKRSGQQGYLTEAFFQMIGKSLPQNLMMVQAFQQKEMVAAALFFKDARTLYGRYWGCRQEFDQLHFEACYYQGIEYAIAKKLQRFDPGAQGEHKIQRGFTPLLTYSHHLIRDSAFRQAVAQFLDAETQQVQQYKLLASERLPFKTKG